MTAMKTATLLLIAAVAFAGVAHGKESEDALDTAGAGRELLNSGRQYWWGGQWHNQPQPQPRTTNSNNANVQDTTSQEATSGNGGNGGSGGLSLLDGNSIAIALIPLGGGTTSGNTGGSSFANGGPGGNSGPAGNSNQNNVGVLGIAGRKLLQWGSWSGPQPQQSRNTNRIKVIDLTRQTASTGNGGKGGDGGISAADANSLALALAPYLSGAKSGDTGGSSFANGAAGGNSGPAINSNKNNVGVSSFAGRKLQNSRWGGSGSQPQPQQARNANRIKIINLTGQSATTGNGGSGGDGGVSALDANSLALALAPFFSGANAKGGDTGGSSFANGGPGGNSGPAFNSNQNNVGVSSTAGRKLLNNPWGGSGSQPQQARNTNRIKVINLTGQSASTGKGGDGGNGGFALGDGNSIAIALLPWGGVQSGNTGGSSFANGAGGGSSGAAVNTNQNNVATGIIGGGK